MANNLGHVVGATGATGPQGPTGATGATGPQGPTGATGSAATITIGTTTTGAAGSSASVSNSGTSSAAVLNFTIPKGDTGATGPQGPKGDTGATGPAGTYTFDDRPLKDSTNPVTSGGIYNKTHAHDIMTFNNPNTSISSSSSGISLTNFEGVHILIITANSSNPATALERSGVYLIQINSNGNAYTIVPIYPVSESTWFINVSGTTLNFGFTGSVGAAYRVVTIGTQNY